MNSYVARGAHRVGFVGVSITAVALLACGVSVRGVQDGGEDSATRDVSTGLDAAESDARRDVTVPLDRVEAVDGGIARDDGSRDVLIPAPPEPETLPTVGPRRCVFASATVRAFDDVVEISRTYGPYAHHLTWDRTARALPEAWLASWVDTLGALHEVRIGDSGGVTNERTIAPAAAIARAGIEAHEGLFGADFLTQSGTANQSIVRIHSSDFGATFAIDTVPTSARYPGHAALLGGTAWVPTTRTGARNRLELRADRLAPDGRTWAASSVLRTQGSVTAPRIVMGRNSVWFAFLQDWDFPLEIAVAPINRSTGEPTGRISQVEGSGACSAIGGFDVLSTYDLPVTVESCDGRGIRLTVFGEFVRPDPPTPTVRTWVRARSTSAEDRGQSLRARVGYNGRELAVAWREPGEQAISVRFVTPFSDEMSARVTIPSPEPVLDDTVEIAALPTSDGAWAVLWSTTSATYLARMGRCGTNRAGSP
ncbi:MAG: hypothetical protein Q8Q09_05620 [Deltaproteobacteria bacterium]|nr:hypothetical protein [Deltaproteobacteria bacterium]